MDNKKNKNWVKRPWNWQSVLLLLMIWIAIFTMFRGLFPEKNIQLIPYSRFKKAVRLEEVSEISVKGDEIYGRFKTNAAGASGSSKQGKRDPRPEGFKTIKPAIDDPNLLPLLEDHNIKVTGITQKRSWFWRFVITLLPWVLIIGFFVYSNKKFQERMGGKGGIFGVGRSKAKLFKETGSDVAYNDVAGLDNAKKELLEIVEYLKDPSRFHSLGGELPKGILLVGPPGVGKTMLARATAGEAGVPFFSISGSEFIEMFVGVGASRVRDMFQKAKKDAPAIIFIDEIDSIGRVRGSGLGGGHDEREQTLNQILSEMDGFSERQFVIVLAATNRPDVLDPALIRPGRFDRRIALELPQKKAREEILRAHARQVALAESVDMKRIAGGTTGFSGADLKNLVNEAALLAARKEKNQVEPEDFEAARDKILLGIEREDVIGGKDKKIIAFHEAGHALMAALLDHADPLEKVTIIPRGRSLGATEQIPQEDRYNYSRSDLLDRLSVMLGGRAAEKVFFDEISTGSSDDLKKATELARRMVCQWGMSERLGPMTFQKGEPHPFLGRELSESRDFSEHTARLIDEEVRKVLTDMNQRAMEIIDENRRAIDSIAQELMENETLSHQEIERILNKASE